MQSQILGDFVGRLNQLGPVEWAWLVAAAVGAYLALTAIRTVFFHPLSMFPGRTSWIVSRIPQALALRSGSLVHDLKRMHDYYGPVVRISANELSFISSQAWHDIYGHHGGEKNFPRNPRYYHPAPNGAHTILSAPNRDHARMRRLLAHAFSDRALKEQEHLVQVYIDFFVERLQAKADGSRPINVKDFFQFATFDIAGDLEFGESFDCLQNENYHYWLAVMLAHFKRLVQLASMLMMAPFLRPFVQRLIPKKLREQRMARFEFSKAKVGKRLAIGDDPKRSDFMTHVCRYNDEKGMSREEIEATFDILVTAGSETTATLLTGVLHYLLRSPQKMNKLKKTLRDRFNDASEIKMQSTSELPYLTAVIQEGLRMAPPAPTMLPRLVPERGASVCGHWLPPNTAVGISQWATFRSSSNFARADEFIPERWLKPEDGGVSLYPHETDAFMPFSFGPRNCLGRNLAWAEVRLLLANLLWHFEVEWRGKHYRWEDQPTFVMWEKEPLMVALKPARK